MRRPPVQPLSLSIVLPCHDEEANVERVVREAVRVGRRIARDLEVVVVDDGSTDRTASLVRALSTELPEVRLVENACNMGYGAALRAGFAAATRPWVFYTDGDGQFEMEQLAAVLPLLETHDIVSCYRVHRRDGPVRLFYGHAWTALMNGLLGLGLRDVNCAFKIYPRALFDHIAIRSTGALVDAEVLLRARQLGLSVAQVGVRHRPRTAGRQTGGRPAVIARAFFELLRLLASEPLGPTEPADDDAPPARGRPLRGRTTPAHARRPRASWPVL